MALNFWICSTENLCLFSLYSSMGFISLPTFFILPNHPTHAAIGKVMGFETQQTWVQAPFLSLASTCSFTFDSMSIRLLF